MGNGNTGQIGGFNPGAMMAGLAMGGAIGKNVAGMVTNMMNDMQQPISAQTPLPHTNNPGSFYVVVNGLSSGPYTIQTLSQMVSLGSVTKESLVWKQGMQDWVQANMIPELQSIFGEAGVATPPPIPPMQ